MITAAVCVKPLMGLHMIGRDQMSRWANLTFIRYCVFRDV